jgi:hypothetical protein
MKATFFILSLLFLSSSNATAQEEFNALQSTIEAYAKGGATNDVQVLGPVLHEQFRVVVSNPAESSVKQLDRTTYLDLIDKKVFGGETREVIVESLQIHSDILAMAKVKRIGKENILHDFLSFARHNGQWYLIQDLATIEGK